MLPFYLYFSLTGQDKCLPCPAGFHCSKGLRRRCPPGFYCPQKTGISFYPCPPGTYNPSYGLSHAERCQQCPAGEGMLPWDLSRRVLISLQLSLLYPLGFGLQEMQTQNPTVQRGSWSHWWHPHRFLEALQKGLVHTQGFPLEHELN